MNDSKTPPPASLPPKASGAGRRRGFIILALIVVIGGLGYFAYWSAYLHNFESTDDAYVNGDVIQVTSEIPGTVLSVRVDDTQTVKQGEVLAELDPADAEVAMSSAEADLARAVRSVRGLFAQGAQARAQIADRQAALQRAIDDLHRRQGLLADGAVSGEELSHSRDAIAQAKAQLDATREQLTQTNAQVEGTEIQNHPQVLAAEAQVRNAALALYRTRLVAPVDGVVAKRTVQVGQRVAAGAPLMAVVPLNNVWIDANFKEVQLSRMRVNQPVEIHTDIYGGDVVFHGKLAGFGAGSGSAFALLPAQNASGNWIKIVQRVPVRILLDPNELKNSPLRIGLSATVKIDIRDTSGNLMAGVVRSVPQPIQASDGNRPEIETRIAQIIAENSGSPVNGDMALPPQPTAQGGAPRMPSPTTTPTPAPAALRAPAHAALRLANTLQDGARLQAYAASGVAASADVALAGGTTAP